MVCTPRHFLRRSIGAETLRYPLSASSPVTRPRGGALPEPGPREPRVDTSRRVWQHRPAPGRDARALIARGVPPRNSGRPRHGAVPTVPADRHRPRRARARRLGGGGRGLPRVAETTPGGPRCRRRSPADRSHLRTSANDRHAAPLRGGAVEDGGRVDRRSGVALPLSVVTCPYAAIHRVTLVGVSSRSSPPAEFGRFVAPAVTEPVVQMSGVRPAG